MNPMKKIYLHLNSRDEFLRIDISKIIYFEADGNYTNIITSNGLRCVVCMNLTQMQQVLTDSLKENAQIFARIGKKHIVNHAYIFQISVQRQKLLLSDGDKFSYTLDISKEALRRLKDIMTGQATK